MNDVEKIARWLEVILLERFGHAFAIQFLDKKIVVSIEGSLRQVEFAQRIDDFYQIKKNKEVPCVYVDVKKEGFLCPIGASLPQPGLAISTPRLVEQDGNTTIVYYDILGLTYWMLSRQEEVEAEQLDNHGRFPATASHAYQHNYLDRPIVDEWLIVLGQIFQIAWHGLQLKQHNFSIKVSHDVDRPSRYGFVSFPQMIRKIAGSLLVRKDFSSIWYAPLIWHQSHKKLHKKDPYNTFDWLMDLSDECHLTSAFYFICGGNAQYDADYTLSDPSIRRLMLNIHRRGHEIGLHPSYHTYQDKEALVSEASHLKRTCAELGIEQECFGGRMHYLRWEPNTMMFWEAAAMDYDSTLSYADHPGFRCGTCFEYPAIDPVTKRTLALRIRPLIVMEDSIGGYLGLGYGDEALKRMNELKNKCQQVNGCFTLLWHNSEFNAGQKALYVEIIR